MDVWRHLNILRDMGADLALVTWYDGPRDGPPSAEQISALEGVCRRIHLAPISRSKSELLRRLGWLGRLPSHAASRWVTAALPDILRLAHEFKPQAILLHGLYGGAVARWLSSRTSVPLVYRSHNIEHRYMKRQLSKAKGLAGRIGLVANLVGLESFERKVINSASGVLDISLDDRKYWMAQGYTHVDWLPTAVTADFAEEVGKQEEIHWDVMYFGNLHTPNNVDGVEWLVDEVLSQVPGELRIALAGSKPSERLLSIARRDRRISVIPNPPQLSHLIGTARILVNPVRAGSGVNLKSVEMLFTDATLISTTTGVQGLPDSAKQCFHIFDGAEQFAACISQAMMAKGDWPVGVTRRAEVRDSFRPQAIARAFERVLPRKEPGPLSIAQD